MTSALSLTSVASVGKVGGGANLAAASSNTVSGLGAPTTSPGATVDEINTLDKSQE